MADVISVLSGYFSFLWSEFRAAMSSTVKFGSLVLEGLGSGQETRR